MAISPYKRFSRSLSKNAVIKSFPEGGKTRVWLESLADDKWSVVGLDPQVREVLLTVTSSDSNDVHNVSLILPFFNES